MSDRPSNFDRVEQIKADLLRELDEAGEARYDVIYQRLRRRLSGHQLRR